MTARRSFRHVPRALSLPAAAILGLAAATGQEPYALPVVMFAALVGIFMLFRLQRTALSAGLLGLVFGWAYFALSLVWILQPFQIDPEAHGWMAPFALVLLSLGLALFWGLAFWLARRFASGSWVLVPAWTGVELLRAYVFTGFPWASPPQALVDTLAGQGLAWVGPHGLMLVLCGTAWALTRPIARLPEALVVRLPLALGAAVVLIAGPLADPDRLTDHVVRLVQPNAPQNEKWRSDRVVAFFERQLGFTEAQVEGGGRPDLVVWPETAIPWTLEDAGPAFDHIALAAAGSPVVLGLNRRDGYLLYNSLVVLDETGSPAQTYDKHHIVPFGEYLPFGNILGRFGIRGMAQRDGNGFSSGPGAQVLDLGAIGKALPLICYEAVFPQDVNAAPERPDFIVQITNDAWFGTDVGPQQHLAQARMRAIEQGLPVLRSANTGISAMIDPHGRVLDSLPLGQAGYVDALLPHPLARTLYSRTGDWPAALLILIGLAVAAARVVSIRVSAEPRDSD
ncbi:apolipoprotein N-acyltransferase [Sulfitobacter sp. D35]|uniref:apolipoprotein N-acyltransferase n=1 Tax=Sulfitobacter sp. D35 TaxID=3083252 RepID=UPI00296F7981|nr:apolipoprotein N-acyltransferase [Sulfitobacter sp. D35]MDW4498679.1 apolipoprotein N-acyltransferase [Sulfitobacter sp. D35]